MVELEILLFGGCFNAGHGPNALIYRKEGVRLAAQIADTPNQVSAPPALKSANIDAPYSVKPKGLLHDLHEYQKQHPKP